MILWGGYNGSYLSTGGRYSPVSEQLDSYQYAQCSFTAKPAHSSLDRKRDDRVGGI